MTSLLQISINFSNRTQISSSSRLSRPCNFYSFSKNSICSFHRNEFGVGSCGQRFQSVNKCDIEKRKKMRTVIVRFMQGPGLNGGGNGDDGGPDTRVLTNIAIGVGVIYLSVTGQLGWILDTIVSVGLLAVILPIVGLGAFYLWASRDIVESDCPHCGTEFQVLKSDVKDDMLECPFCSQPFSVVDDEFIPDPEKFYNQPNSFDQAFTRRSKQGDVPGKIKSRAVVDIEAEVKDAD